MKNYNFILSITVVLIFCSCKKDQVVVQTASPFNSYAPADTGRWILYDVDSTFYNNFTNPSVLYHFTFQVIERIDSTYIDNEGRQAQRLERVKRDNAAAPWQSKVIWTSTLATSRYEKVEDGIRFVKLGFPINAHTTWNGNAFNTLGIQDYSYKDLHLPKTIFTLNFDSTVTVNQGDSANVVNEKNGIEIFANHVGMIYKKFVDITFDTIPNHAGGVSYIYTIHSYGLHNAPMPVQ